jgi:hypothetical protein
MYEHDEKINYYMIHLKKPVLLGLISVLGAVDVEVVLAQDARLSASACNDRPSVN